MKIFIDDVEICDLDDNKKRIISSYINKDFIKETIISNVNWSIKSFYDQHLNKLKQEWLPVLFKRYKSIPTSDEELTELIFSQEDYIDQFTKENKAKASKDAKFTVE